MDVAYHGGFFQAAGAESDSDSGLGDDSEAVAAVGEAPALRVEGLGFPEDYSKNLLQKGLGLKSQGNISVICWP